MSNLNLTGKLQSKVLNGLTEGDFAVFRIVVPDS
jgi:hypothetical protein